MTVLTPKARLILGSLLTAGWIMFIWSEQVASSAPMAALMFVALYGLTLYTLGHSNSFALPPLVWLVFGTIAAGVVFTFWGTLLDKLFLPALIPTETKSQRISLLLFNGALVATITGLVVGYPLRKLFARFWWFPILTAAFMAAFIMFPSLQILRIPQLDTWGAILTATDLAFLLTLTPLVALMVHRAAANNSFKPKPLRGSA